MYLPKVEIYNALKILPASVLQGSQAVFTKTPAITFTISDNSVELDLNNEISSQDIVATIDIWADSSMEASDLLKQSEEIMRNLGYRLSFSMDVPQPEGALYHINCRYNAKK